MLAGVALGAYAVALVVVTAALKPGRWLAALAWGFVVWLPLYLLASLAAVEMWRRRKLAGFDRAIRQLHRELATWREAIDRLTWEIRELERRPRATAETAARRSADQSAEWLARIDAWEGAGGLARVRSLKLGEWRSEIAALDPAGLAARRRELEAAAAQAEPERREQLEVQLALIRLREAEASEPVPDGAAASAGAPTPLDEARRRRAEAERELARLQAELGNWQRDRAAFISRRIQLD